MRRILILTGRYLPGYKDGGPLRTLINITDSLGDEYEFYIVCLDRDHGDLKPYDNIKYNEWNRVGKANVWYTERFTRELVTELSKNVDLIYSCGFYDEYGRYSLLLNKFNRLNGKPLVVASMGTFSKGALSHKRLKKKLFISIFKLLGLFNNITWSVTSELEASDLKDNIGKRAKYIIAEDLPRNDVPGIGNRDLNDKSIVFLSRICPQKNLLGAIKAVAGLKDEVKFDIYGPQEDEKYWKQCESMLTNLPSNIRWNYCGNVPTEKVQSVLQRYNIFLFPTLGENYGHVIFEALSVGCIPVISDQTPWKLNDAGFFAELGGDYSQFTKIIESYFSSDLTIKKLYTNNAISIAKRKVSESKIHSGYREIFR